MIERTWFKVDIEAKLQDFAGIDIYPKKVGRLDMDLFF